MLFCFMVCCRAWYIIRYAAPVRNGCKSWRLTKLDKGNNWRGTRRCERGFQSQTQIKDRSRETDSDRMGTRQMGVCALRCSPQIRPLTDFRYRLRTAVSLDTHIRFPWLLSQTQRRSWTQDQYKGLSLPRLSLFFFSLLLLSLPFLQYMDLCGGSISVLLYPIFIYVILFYTSKGFKYVFIWKSILENSRITLMFFQQQIK